MALLKFYFSSISLEQNLNCVMKKVFAFVLFAFFVFQSFATSIIKPPQKAADIFVPVGTTGKRISLLELSQLDLKSFETLTGRHLRFIDRIGFKIAQRDLRKSINRDGTIDARRLNRFKSSRVDHSTGFHIGGFALGFFVGLIGVLIAYLIKDDYKRNRVKWSWIGLGIRTILSVALLLVYLSSWQAW